MRVKHLLSLKNRKKKSRSPGEANYFSIINMTNRLLQDERARLPQGQESHAEQTRLTTAFLGCDGPQFSKQFTCRTDQIDHDLGHLYHLYPTLPL